MATTESNASTEFFVLGYWANAHRAKDREYYWMRGFDSRKDAQAAGKRKQANGQPSTFRDWCGGGNQVFSSAEKFVAAANKVGLNPRMED
jgi:hypothetical protein